MRISPKFMESVIILAFLAIMTGLFYRFTIQNSTRIQSQNEAYAKDSATQMALNLHDEFKSSQELIEAYAFYLNKTLASPAVSDAILKELEDNSPFDAIRFTTPDGISHTSDNITTNSSDRKVYQQGMQGKTGMAIFDSRFYHESVLNFFAPVKFNGEIIGVLYGARLAKTFLRQLLEAAYFGQPADVFLCGATGSVLASSHTVIHGNIVSGLLTEELIDASTAQAMTEALEQKRSASFIFDSANGAVNISLVHIPQYNYNLVQIFPTAVTQAMIMEANKAGVELELGLFVLFGVVAALLLIRSRLQKRALEIKNSNLAMITQGVNTLFAGRYLLCDFNTGECVYVGEENPDSPGPPVPYAEIFKNQLTAMPGFKDREEFKQLFTLENLKKEFEKHSTLAFACKIMNAGQETWENIIAINLKSPDPSEACFLIVHQDFTELKQREQKAKSKIADMNRKERQYQLALTANAFAAYEFNVTTDKLENDITQKVEGREISLLAARNLALPCRASEFLASWQVQILPESRQEYMAKTNISWLRKKFYEGIQEIEIDFWIQDVLGQEQCIRQSFYMAANDLTGDVMALTVMRDITAQVVKQRSQTKALQDALLLAQHANEAKTTFLSNMSHDIRTPMNAIIGFATIASEHLENTGQVRECLRKVLSSSNHLLNLINDILDMSRIESGKMQIREQPCNLSQLMHDVVMIIQPQVKAKRMRLSIETFDISNEDVITDPLKLNQIFINLLGNAVKYTPAEGCIFFRMTQKPAFKHGFADYVFEVEDNGIGMTPEFVEHIFEPFTRATTTTQSGIQGTGLGMAITRSIIEMMNGHIEVETEPGKGSRFIVTLTLKLQDESSASQDMKNLEGARALIVDDDFYVCDSVSKMLLSLGLDPKWTTSGREALYRACQAQEEGEPFQVIFVDWQMPELDGLATARQLRGDLGQDVPIIFLTAYAWVDIEEDAEKIGNIYFCAKPLFMSDLKTVLLAALLKKEPVQEEKPVAQFENARILLVDDVEMNREVAEFILTENGFQVETAPDGTDAVEMVRNSPEGHFDAILMDVQMPTMNGYEATRIIRNLERGDVKTMPILAMTANALEEDKANALKSGMNDHIAKPIDVKLFFEILGKYLKR